MIRKELENVIYDLLHKYIPIHKRITVKNDLHKSSIHTLSAIAQAVAKADE